MEPILRTAPRLASVAAELRAREPVFHRPELGTTRADLERMTDADFWEVGASGRRYSRAYVIDRVVQRQSSPREHRWEIRGFHCADLSDRLFLVTYTLIEDGARVTRRMTLWRRAAGEWKIVYHQGTPVEESSKEAAA